MAMATSSTSTTTGPNVAFVGLGAMGYPMASNLSRGRAPDEPACLVHNRTAAVAERHAAEFGTRAVVSLGDLRGCAVVFLCLPTSREVDRVCDDLVLDPGAIVADCTSGDPLATRRIAARLAARGIAMVDCPVSGGPAGAASGQLTSMVGGGEDAVVVVEPYLRRMAQKKVLRVGAIGAGHAVKAVNNTLNTAHLAIAAEGLLALAEFGISPDLALAAINGSSGRSLQTEVRIPKEVLSREFDYGFPLGLMLKDVSIAVDSVCSSQADTEGTKFFPLVKNLLQQAVALESAAGDYSRVVRPLEARAGRELHAGGGEGADGRYTAPPYAPSREGAPGD